MSTLKDDANKAFLDLVIAFEQFRQAWERALAEQEAAKTELSARPPPPQQPNQRRLLTRREAAEYLGVAPQTLAWWHVPGSIPCPW